MSQSYGTVDDKRPTVSGRKVIWLTSSEPASTTTAASGGVVGHRIGLTSTPTLANPTQSDPTNNNCQNQSTFNLSRCGGVN